MMTVKTARMLTRYNQWANKSVFDAVAALPEGEAVKSRVSLFKNMVHMLNHNYVIDRIFQAHLEGRPHGYAARNTADHPPLAELWTAQQEVDGWYVAWSDRLTQAQIDEQIDFKYVGGGEGRLSRGEILLHIVNHTSYHRGFVGEMIFNLKIRAPAADLTVFLRDARPALD